LATIKLKYILCDRDRHGNVRVYFRKRGLPMVRIREDLETPDFMRAYQKILKGEVSRAAASIGVPPQPGSWRALCISYFGSVDFTTKLDLVTQRRRRAYLEATFAEPINPDSTDVYGDVPIDCMTTKAISVLRDRKAALPEAANMRLKSIRQVFKWAMKPENELASANPARDVEYFSSNSTGFHSWSIEEVEAFEERHPISTKPRLAFALMLYLGVRRSDVVRIGPQHVRDGNIRFKVFKGRNKTPTELVLPVLPALAEIIAATPCGHLSFLVTQYGEPYSAKGFGAKMRRWCNQAGLPECSSHGLRKIGATIAAENGATDHQLMAMYGWKTIKEAQRYTKAARQKVLAASGMPLLNRAKADQK